MPLRLHDFDLQIVRYCAGGSQTGVGRMLAVGVSKLGNGWVYPPLALLLVIAFGARAWLVVLAGSAATAIGQALLAALKKWRPRLRPYQQATDLDSLLPVQNQNSFPSGHVMTLSAVTTPAVLAFPALVWLAAPLLLLMAWARMACAHHYPSDVVAGAAMGFAISYPISALALIVFG